MSSEPSVENAVEQLTAKRAQMLSQAEREVPAGAKQAPPLLLSQCLALESLICCEKAPLYVRFYAWV